MRQNLRKYFCVQGLIACHVIGIYLVAKQWAPCVNQLSSQILHSGVQLLLRPLGFVLLSPFKDAFFFSAKENIIVFYNLSEIRCRAPFLFSLRLEREELVAFFPSEAWV